MLRRRFENVIDLTAGVEIRVPGTGLAVRGGYSHLPSPYAEGYGPGGARKVISIGAGLNLQDQLVVDGVYSWTSWEGNDYWVYRDEAVRNVNTDATKVMVSVRYMM
jgi:hypothetical protein